MGKVEKRARARKLPNAHPRLYTLKVICTDGTQFVTRSTMPTGEIKLEVDTKTHPAWLKKELAQDCLQSNSLKKYREKYRELLS
ncbi:50S ribosomal protein L31 [Candidatus Hodgkinia cicadicola]|nr:50S ribosomal protein L31 [Candidatus Hodgkinia cicadicola]